MAIVSKNRISAAVRQAPLSEGVERKLEGRILSGQWEQGYKLPSEGKLCEEFGVSRTAVREALRELRGRGIIETVNGSGSYVSGGNLEMVSKAMTAYSGLTTEVKATEDLMEFRVLLEGAAVGRLARSHEKKAAPLQLLIDVLDAMCDAKDTAEFGKLDSKFHLIILETCNNAFINMIGQTLHTHYQRYIAEAHTGATEGMRQQTLSEHAAVVEAIKNSDADAAREALEEHLSAAGERTQKLGIKK
ncbi:MAG: GntR family transcriptional repressor for pyruvate dehydrogenase complex [Crocinitomicaceae bacterium]|jgi:GntR family transcriptional repressor for pyruvate dehydrogenase complex